MRGGGAGGGKGGGESGVGEGDPSRYGTPALPVTPLPHASAAHPPRAPAHRPAAARDRCHRVLPGGRPAGRDAPMTRKKHKKRNNKGKNLPGGPAHLSRNPPSRPTEAAPSHTHLPPPPPPPIAAASDGGGGGGGARPHQSGCRPRPARAAGGWRGSQSRWPRDPAVPRRRGRQPIPLWSPASPCGDQPRDLDPRPPHHPKKFPHPTTGAHARGGGWATTRDL